MGLSLPRIGMGLNRLFAMPCGLRPREALAFLQAHAGALQDIETHGTRIEDRGLAASWLRFTAMFNRLSPLLREAATAPRQLDELWSPSTLETIDRDIHTLVDKHPPCTGLLDNDARLWWRLEPMRGATAEKKLTRDELRALVMHTHSRHAFFELHGFAQRARRSGFVELAAWFAPNLIGLRGAYNKLMLNGFGVELVVRKGLRDGRETDAVIQRLGNQETVYMPMGSWGDTTFCFVEKPGYSNVFESEVKAVEVTLFGTAFMEPGSSSVYREYLVPEGRIALDRVERSFAQGCGSHTAFGKDFDVFKLRYLPGDFTQH